MLFSLSLFLALSVCLQNSVQISMSSKNKSEGILSSSSSSSPHSVHPMLERAYHILEPMFCQYILPSHGHGLMATPQQWEALLDTLPTSTARETVGANLKRKWAQAQGTAQELSPQDKWKQLLQHLRVKFDLPDHHHHDDTVYDIEDDDNNVNRDWEGTNRISNTTTATTNKRPKLSAPLSLGDMDKEKQRIVLWPMEVVFQHTYPRLDINVSKMQNHLLKSPFCIHPKTGRVCVPMDVTTVDSFDPFAVPTLPQLMQELDHYHATTTTTTTTTTDAANAGTTTPTAETVQFEWQKTSLKPYFEGFQNNFLRSLQADL